MPDWQCLQLGSLIWDYTHGNREAKVAVSRPASAFHKSLKSRFLNPSWEQWCPHSLSGHLPTGQTDFPTEIIRAEPTSPPPGQPCLWRFNQKLEKVMSFIVLPTHRHFKNWAILFYYRPIIYGLFISEIRYGGITRGRRPCFPPCPLKLGLSFTNPEIHECHIYIHCSRSILPTTHRN